jgi:UDP-glucose 4-epimerase
MNILVSSGTGYIGSHAAVLLSQACRKVILLDNFSNSNPSALKRLQKTLDKALPCFEGDNSDSMLATKAPQDCKIDVVTNFTGLNSIGELTEKLIQSYTNNVLGMISLLNITQSFKAKSNKAISCKRSRRDLEVYLHVSQKMILQDIN